MSQPNDIRVNERRRCVAWLHARADSMNDPHARAVLNSAATNLGWTIGEMTTAPLSASPATCEDSGKD